MSEIAQQQRAAGDAYRTAHPEVDWSTNIVTLRHNPDGSWDGIGHRFHGPREQLALLCCEPDDCPQHAAEVAALRAQIVREER
jgi:hypothetical protein